MAERGGGWRGWLAIALGVAVAWGSIAAQGPPPAASADAPPGEFSAGRAGAVVAEVAVEPHPTGSPANDRAREVILRRLQGLGIEAEVQAPRDPASPLRNVVARVPGKGPSGRKALMLCAHYDSVPHGPGAGDDGSGVAVILETLRALRAGPPLDRDLIALIDDGEERGLHGAHLFVDEHPRAGEVGVVLNFDARGTSGPSFMFETSDGNGWLVRQFAAASPRPLATSVSMDIYRLMSNSTDLTVFKQAGMAGLNFAFSRGLSDYHTRDDTPANLDPRTLQHQGENALALTRHLGHLDLDDVRRDDVVYFSILNRAVVIYPVAWAWPLGAVPALLWVVVAAVGWRRGRVGLLDLAAGLGAWPLAAFVAVFAAGGFWLVLRDVVTNLGLPVLRVDLPILTACAVVAATVMLLLERRLGRGRPAEALGLGGLAWWAALALATARWAPGMSYVFAWPTLAALVALGASLLWNRDSGGAVVANFLGAAPTLVLMPPMTREAFQALSFRMTTPLMLLVVITLGAILPILGPIVAPRRLEGAGRAG